jgi:hypothetical protein
LSGGFAAPCGAQASRFNPRILAHDDGVEDGNLIDRELGAPRMLAGRLTLDA